MFKKILAIAVVTAIFAAYSSNAHALATGNPNVAECAACHKLSTAEAGDLLFSDMMNAKILSVQSSQKILGYWEVNLEQLNPQDNKIYPLTVYIDYGKQNFLLGKIAPLSDLGRKIDISKIPTKNALLLGNKKAKYKVIVFTDPDCPFCRKFHATATTITKEFNDIAFYLVLYPLDIHPGAYDKALAIDCEKSVKLLEDAFAGKALNAAKCDSKKNIDSNIELAKGLGITGTPALIFPNGIVVPGNLDYETFMRVFDSLMKTNYSGKK